MTKYAAKNLCTQSIVYNRFETSVAWFETLKKQLLLHKHSVVVETGERRERMWGRCCCSLSCCCVAVLHGSFLSIFSQPGVYFLKREEKNLRCVWAKASYVVKSMVLSISSMRLRIPPLQATSAFSSKMEMNQRGLLELLRCRDQGGTFYPCSMRRAICKS